MGILWRILRLLALLGIAAAVSLAATGCSAGDPGGGTTRLTIGYVTTPESPWGIAIQGMADGVSRRTHGAVQIEPLPSYSNANDIQLLGDVQGTAVDMAVVSTAVLDAAGQPSFQALQMPFLITNYAAEAAVFASSIPADMMRPLRGIGLQGLALLEGGIRRPASNGPCLITPQSFQGAPFRAVESSLLVAGVRALGADPTPLPLSDVYLGLRQGTITALEGNLALFYTQKLYEVMDCVALNVNLWPFPSVAVINDSAMARLTPDQRRVVTEEAAGMTKTAFGVLTDPKSPFLADLCEQGVAVGIASAASLAQLKAEEQSVYREFTATEPTGGFTKRIEQIVKSVKPPAPAPVPAQCTVTK